MPGMMNSQEPRSLQGWQTPKARITAFAVSAVAAVYLGFAGLSVQTAETVVKRGGYFVMALTVALWLASLWRLRRVRVFAVPLTRPQWWAATGAIAVLTLTAVSSEPYHSKVINDEFVLQSTAFNLHFFREVATMVRGYDIGGLFVSTDNYLDKRPYFYPFLVSLAHDLTGYRPVNAFVVNTVLMPVALGLAFALGRLFRGWRGGMIALLLLGSLPLLGQNATGSGMELVNAVMILATMFLGAVFLAKPEPDRMVAFLFATALLAQSRYESALYVFAAALVVVMAWIRLRRIDLPLSVALLPWLLLPVALQNRVLSHTPILWELSERAATRFGVEFLPNNTEGAFAFLFHFGAQQASSLTLSVLGLLGLGWTAWRFFDRIRRRRLDFSPAAAALTCFGFVILANTLLVFCYYWSRFDDPIAARFSLPLHLLMAFAAVACVGALDTRMPVSRALMWFVALVPVGAFTAKSGYHIYSYMGTAEVEWQRRYVEAMPPKQRLILTNQSTVPWLLYKTPSILVGRARLVADRLQHQMAEPTFNEILVMQTLRPSTADGDHQIVPEDMLPEFFKLELLVEKRFGTRISRISRLLAVDLPPDWSGQSSTVPPKPAKGAE